MNVLIVDDDRATLEFMSDAVKHEGHTTYVAENGEEAMTLYTEFNPDLVITDIRMPRVDGLELLKLIRKNDQQIKVIVTTAFGSEDYAKQALEYGASGYINKPVRIRELTNLVRETDISNRRNRIRKNLESRLQIQKFSMTVDNRMERAPDIAAILTEKASVYLGEDVLAGVHMGLLELITNAIEHGNLNISSEEKREALAGEPGDMLKLYQRKSHQGQLLYPEFARMLVHINVSMTPDYCEWTVKDEGDGFDWEQEAIASADRNENASTATGIDLCRIRFDELHHMGNGNTVRVRKYTCK
ncbi:MAG: response regulator [Candidatus Hydrogenedentota bacterium]